MPHLYRLTPSFYAAHPEERVSDIWDYGHRITTQETSEFLIRQKVRDLFPSAVWVQVPAELFGGYWRVGEDIYRIA